ncbi:cyclic nucleotide-binding domain-containing protein [Synechococcus lacustris Tous-12m]
MLCLLGPGDVFGEMALLDEKPRSADVLSLTPVNLVKFSGALFRQLMLSRAPFHWRLPNCKASACGS